MPELVKRKVLAFFFYIIMPELVKRKVLALFFYIIMPELVKKKSSGTFFYITMPIYIYCIYIYINLLKKKFWHFFFI